MSADARGGQYLGFQGVAEALSTDDHVVYRQQVYAWYVRRDRNGFPERELVDGRLLFDLEAVRDWLVDYVPNPGGRPRQRR